MISGKMCGKKKSPRVVNSICLLLIFFFSVFCAEGQKTDNQSAKTVVIDAGHGGRDPGTVVGVAKEKNVVLDIALKLGKLIKKNQNNIKVVYTRDGDYYIPLMDRAQMANKINADLFISIHANYCSSPAINGTETYVLGLHRTEDNLNVAKKENSVILLEENYTKRYEGFNPNLSESYIMFELIQDTYLTQSLKFASILQSNFKELAQRHDREVRQAGFLVLRETSMPSVLIETGYLSNKKENMFLLTESGRSEIAHSIYGSLLSYLNKMETNDNPSSMPVQESVNENKPSLKSKQTPNSSKSKPVQDTSQSRNSQTEGASSNRDRTVILKDPKAENNVSDNPVVENGQRYAIQIGVFSKKIDIKSKVFKGISPVKEITSGARYKYLCYESETFEAVKANFAKVLTIFPDAFIVSVKNNQVRMVGDGHGKK
jgi:N-acetylmuramoyl-L-alanine amidase